MRPQNIIYVAIHKKRGQLMSGVKGQYAYGDVKNLKQSIGHSYSYEAKKLGVKAVELYYIYKVNIDTMTRELVE